MTLHIHKDNCVVRMGGRPAAVKVSQWFLYCHAIWLAEHKYKSHDQDIKYRGQNSKRNSPSREVEY